MKVYANNLSGVRVMAKITQQCNSFSQMHSSVYFRLKIVWQVCRAYVHGRNYLTNVQKRKLPGFTQAPASAQKSM